MDRLYYYIRKTDESMKSALPRIDGLAYFKGRNSSTQGNDDDDGSNQEEDYEDVDDEEGLEGDDDDDDSSSSSSSSTSGGGMSGTILSFWNERRKILCSDYAIAGWMLCPLPEVYEDAKANSKGEDRACVSRVLEKLYNFQTTEEKYKTFDTFWEEYEHFRGKDKMYKSRFIWHAQTLQGNGCSYKWHKMYSHPFTEVLGKVACRVTSKILGIGNAERSWGAVKQLKQDKRSKLSANAVKKQATLFGKASIDAARIRDKDSKKSSSDDSASDVLWTDEDEAFSKQYDLQEVAIEEPVRPIFKAWLEDWELEGIKVNKPVVKRKFLAKYGGMTWYDPDWKRNVTARSDEMDYQRRKNSDGWLLLCPNPDDVEDEDEAWTVSLALQTILDTEDRDTLNSHVRIELPQETQDT